MVQMEELPKFPIIIAELGYQQRAIFHISEIAYVSYSHPNIYIKLKCGKEFSWKHSTFDEYSALWNCAPDDYQKKAIIRKHKENDKIEQENVQKLIDALTLRIAGDETSGLKFKVDER